MFTTCAYAADVPSAVPASSGGALVNLMPLILIFGIFYFLIIRPQQRKAREHQSLLNGLKKNDQVLTSGGIYGTVAALRGAVVELKIADEVKIRVAKSAVTSLFKEEQPVAEAQTPKVG